MLFPIIFSLSLKLTLRFCRHAKNNDIKNTTMSGSIVELVDSIIKTGIEKRASDIHIEPMAEEMRVRYRIDGELFVRKVIDRTVADALIAKLKLLTGAKLDETLFNASGLFKSSVGDEQDNVCRDSRSE